MKLSEIFWALGDPIRFAVVEALIESPRNVSELVTIVGAPQPNVSRHLKALRDRGVIEPTRNGKWVEYSLREEAVEQLRRWAARAANAVAVPVAAGRAPARPAARSSEDDTILFCE